MIYTMKGGYCLVKNISRLEVNQGLYKCTMVNGVGFNNDYEYIIREPVLEYKFYDDTIIIPSDAIVCEISTQDELEVTRGKYGVFLNDPSI